MIKKKVKFSDFSPLIFCIIKVAYLGEPFKQDRTQKLSSAKKKL